jgi:hypothetical protein
VRAPTQCAAAVLGALGRVKAMDRVRTRLEKLQRRVVDGRLKADDLGNGTTKRSVTTGTQRAAGVLRALGRDDGWAILGDRRVLLGSINKRAYRRGRR